MHDIDCDAWPEKIRQAALDLGFCQVGFSPIEPLVRDAQALTAWLEQGYHADMHYMQDPPRRDDPQALVPQTVKSLVVVALAYPKENPLDELPPLSGFVARYARGQDYHQVLKQKLYALAKACEHIVGRAVVARPCVDTAPLLERGYAAHAGVGFIAKSCLSIVPKWGSYVLLGELLLDIDLPPSKPLKSRCGSCTACLVACPTQAFVAPYTLDARRCISYLTIELRGVIPIELRPLIGNMIAGCDICQQVCPFNASKKPRPTPVEFTPKAHLLAPDLSELLQITAANYRKWVRNTALTRLSRQQLQRNAAVALGNSGDAQAIEPLLQALNTNRYPLVRGHVAWALGALHQIATPAVHHALQHSSTHDADNYVQQEARQAIDILIQ